MPCNVLEISGKIIVLSNAYMLDQLYRRLGVILLQLYLVVLGWTDAFSLSSWFPLHVAILTLIAILYFPCLAKGLKGQSQIFPGIDVMLIFAMAFYFSAVAADWNEKTPNYIAAYCYTFLVGYGILKVLMLRLLTRDNILNANLVGILIVSTYAFLEVLIEGFTGVDIQDYVPRHREATATFLHGMIPRAYGLATEPTILVMYLNALGPLALWQLSRVRAKSKYIIYLGKSIIVGAWVVTFSVGGYVFMLIGLISALFVYSLLSGIKSIKNDVHSNRDKPIVVGKKRLGRILGKIILLVFVLPILLLMVMQIDTVNKLSGSVADAVIMKIGLSDDNPSAVTRKQQWRKSVETIIDNAGMPEGLGSSSAAGRTSSLNWYLFVALEGGVFAAAAFIIFILGNAILIALSTIDAKYYILAGFVASALHLTIVSTFYHPFLWVLIAIFHVLRTESVAVGRQNSNLGAV